MKKKKIGRSVFFIIVVLMGYTYVSGLARAAIREPLVLWNQENRRALDLSSIEKQCSFLQRTNKSVIVTENYIPTYLEASSNESDVARKILVYNLNRFLTSDQVRQSSVGQWTQNINESLSSEMVILSPDNKVKHQIKFQVRAEQSRAELKYSGYLQAQFYYQLDNKTLGLQMSRPLNETTTVAFNHVTLAGEVKNVVSLQWVF